MADTVFDIFRRNGDFDLSENGCAKSLFEEKKSHFRVFQESLACHALRKESFVLSRGVPGRSFLRSMRPQGSIWDPKRAPKPTPKRSTTEAKHQEKEKQPKTILDPSWGDLVVFWGVILGKKRRNTYSFVSNTLIPR